MNELIPSSFSARVAWVWSRAPAAASDGGGRAGHGVTRVGSPLADDGAGGRNGGATQLGDKFGNNPEKQAEADLSFRATGEMLTALGLEKFEKNFKKGQLNDSCLTLLTEG